MQIYNNQPFAVEQNTISPDRYNNLPLFLNNKPLLKIRTLIYPNSLNKKPSQSKYWVQKPFEKFYIPFKLSYTVMLINPWANEPFQGYMQSE